MDPGLDGARMRAQEFDTVILGGGCTGSTVAVELARRGYGAIGIVDSGREVESATANSGGMIRVFHESPDHVHMALRSRKMLDGYGKAGLLENGVTPNGCLYFFNKERYEGYQQNLKLMDEAGYRFEILTEVCGRKRFPEFRWKAGEWAVFEPEAAHLEPLAFASQMRKAAGGAVRMVEAEVQRIVHHRHEYRLFAGDQVVLAKTLVLAGGARMLPRLRDLGLNLPLEARPLSMFVAPVQQSGPRRPNFFDRETLEFGRFGDPRNMVLSNPRTRRLLKRPARAEFKQRSALDCYAPGRHGFAGQVPGLPNLLVATGWGGTGFKFSFAIAEKIAKAVETLNPKRSPSYAPF